ncbi:hypothetical protein B0H63DRAFT_556782 [Podospora didyma]|uniref:FAD-binding domain-containing protein n=1 Tax=Podospora didyma TaxID=330526 RepID=A0AAE0NXX2_9PEZI|nr:hypothetical protein B0H63DRAFT_556782 [Podospora didyma]
MRVIILGSGPTGLLLAHALAKLNHPTLQIIILEQRADPVDPTGAGLGLWPHSVRILDQLGLLPEAKKLVPEMKTSIHLGPHGGLLSESNLFDRIVENHGHPFMFFERAKLIQLLYERLENREGVVLAGKKAVSILEKDDVVEVTCEEGPSFVGDILVGCDGSHSIARRFVESGLRQYPALSPTTAVGKVKASAIRMPSTPCLPFKATFRCLFGISQLPAGLDHCAMIETHDQGVMIQLLTSDDRTYFLLYEAKTQQDDGLQTTRYSDADAEAVAKRYENHSVGKEGKVTFGDLWKNKIRANLFDLEEGVLSQWFSGRVVLAGDSVHKMTANLAFGLNVSLEDVASLTNRLQGLLVTQHATRPTTSEIEALFADYQAERYSRAKTCVEMTGLYTRFATWNNVFFKWMNLYVAPRVGDMFVADWVFSWIPRGGVVLTFLEESDPKRGKVKYLH